MRLSRSLSALLPCRVRTALGRAHVSFLTLVAFTTSSASAQVAPSASLRQISGRVINAHTGAAMPRVLVQANETAAFTSAEGRFQLSSTSPIQTVQFTKPGFALSPEQRDPPLVFLPPGASDAPLEVELWPEAVLAGTATSPEGDPIAHLPVTVRRLLYIGSGLQSQPSGFAVTDTHGRYRIPVPAGEYIVQSRLEQSRPGTDQSVLPSEVPSHIDDSGRGALHVGSGEELHVDLHPQLAVTHSFTVPIEGSPGQRNPSLAITTAEGLRYQAPYESTSAGMALQLAPGDYRVDAHTGGPDGQRFGSAAISVPDHDASGAPLHLDPIAAIPVVATLAPDAAGSGQPGQSAPPDAATLNLQLESTAPESPGDPGHSIRITRPPGQGSSFAAPPGTYRLQTPGELGWDLESASYGTTDLLRHDLTVSPNSSGEPIRLILRRASGSLTAVTRIAGVPSACWIVFLGDPGTFPSVFVRRSDANGQFTSTNLPLRHLRLLALPFLYSGDPASLERFATAMHSVTVSTSTSATLTLDAVPAHELYP